ncbi:hypothetical protein HanXRQr2_Chr15g0695571 [Helianthus annuus]|uniref:Uncharacterized protein n=1 Tax=Helianthus annuus TaxID=4232 RepID=A0A9K3H390_HELAN|nr:hypothetical protein HanXRQr2_Chr15g0695571 [Helianthus annuus]
MINSTHKINPSLKHQAITHHVYKHVIGMFMCLSKMFMCKFVDR